MKRYIRSGTKIEIGEYNANDSEQVRMVQALQSGDVDKYGNSYKSKLYRLTKAYQLLEPQYDKVHTALANIFSEYGLEVSDEFIHFYVYPQGWYWPYDGCKAILFSDFAVDEEDIVVPASYLDGVHTTLPQSAIDEAVRACERLSATSKYKRAVIKSDQSLWPSEDEWNSIESDEQFENMWDLYMSTTENDVNRELRILTKPSIQGNAGSMIIFDLTTNGDRSVAVNYQDWCDKELEMAASSTSRKEYKEKYKAFVDDLIASEGWR